MTKVYCNFMAQIYQWLEYRKNDWGSFLLYLIKLTVKMIGWKDQDPETELSIKHLKLSIAHCTKACWKLFWYGPKPALLISHTLVDPYLSSSLRLIREQKPIFLC